MSKNITVTHWDDVRGQSKAEKEYTWPEFYSWLQTIPRQPVKENSPLIKLAAFGEKRSDKNCLRIDQNVLHVSGIEGDGDNGKLTVDQVKEKLEHYNVRGVVVTSHSHTQEHPKWRVFTPFSENRPPEERRRYVARLNGILEGNLASESFTLSQSYFVGGSPDGEYRVETTFDDPEEGYCIDDSYLDGLDEIADYGSSSTNEQTRPEVGSLNEDLKAAEAAGLEPEHDVRDYIGSSSGMEKYARKVLKSCCDKIRQSQLGSMHKTRLRMSRLIGGYLQFIPEDEVYWALEQAVKDSGTKDLSASMRTIKDGLEHGKLNPLHPGDPISPTSQK